MRPDQTALTHTYPLAKPGIFKTIQGEGALLGVPMVFVRLAGCSIGCPQCDTDYRVHERITTAEICERVEEERDWCKWTWITGGEPADHDLNDLVRKLKTYADVALATSGAKGLSGADTNLSFISISPHGKPEDLKLRPGTIHRYVQTQINLVPGLNGLNLADWSEFATEYSDEFSDRWVTPMDRSRVDECSRFAENHPGWRLGIQAHKTWGIA
jgi:organic radical activating enzyme